MKSLPRGQWTKNSDNGRVAMENTTIPLLLKNGHGN